MDALGDDDEDDGLLVKKKNPIHNTITAAQVSLAESSLEARRVAEEIARKNKSLPKRKQQFCGIRTTFADSDDEEDDETAQEQFAEKLKMELEDADEEDIEEFGSGMIENKMMLPIRNKTIEKDYVKESTASAFKMERSKPKRDLELKSSNVCYDA
jgi:hypothetical protein